MIDHGEPPLADDWPSLADATAMVPKVTSSACHHEQRRPLKLPRGHRLQEPRLAVRARRRAFASADVVGRAPSGVTNCHHTTFAIFKKSP
jgi:hypothetical protein